MFDLALPFVEPRSEYINEFSEMGIVGWYDLKNRCSTIPNLMNRCKNFTNLVPSNQAPMNTDSNSDGIVDGFTAGQYPGTTSVFTLDAAAQRIDVESVTDMLGGYVYQYTPSSASPSEVVSFCADIKTQGDVYANLYIYWYNGGTPLALTTITNITSADFATFSVLAQTAPANTTKGRITFKVCPNALGSSGSGWCRNLRIVKAATINHTGHTNATVSGATAHPLGRYFDGTDDYVSIPHDGIFDNNLYSMVVFFKNYVAMQAGSNTGYLQINLNATYGGLRFGESTGSLTNELITVVDEYSPSGRSGWTTATYVIQPKWHIVAFKWNGTYYDIYFDGSWKTITTSATPTLMRINNILIGKLGDETKLFNGIVGDVLFGNKALSVAQVKQIQKMLAWQYPGLAIA